MFYWTGKQKQNKNNNIHYEYLISNNLFKLIINWIIFNETEKIPIPEIDLYLIRNVSFV